MESSASGVSKPTTALTRDSQLTVAAALMPGVQDHTRGVRCGGGDSADDRGTVHSKWCKVLLAFLNRIAFAPI